MKKILFSCVGTTDPIRGEHDGPMLHILRYYRPESVYIFLSDEIREHADADKRFEKTFEWMKKHWDNYAPEINYIDSKIQDAHEMDVLDGPMYEAMNSISSRFPDAEILINITSGTPQMQMILSQLAMDTRYHARGIQVGNFERKSGTSQRTNAKDYDIDLELECNEDDLPDAANRCTEPQMFAIRREYIRRQISTLLDQRNFDAVEKMDHMIPSRLMPLVSHIAARNRLDSANARKRAGEMTDLPFSLYKYKSGDRSTYNMVCEYYLLMKNLVRSEHITEFLLHLEPMTLQLQLSLLNKLMKPERISTADFIIDLPSGRQLFEPEQLRMISSELYSHYEACMVNRNWNVKEADISTYICDDLLSYYGDLLPSGAKLLFAHYNGLKETRNRLAHELCTITDEDVVVACGVNSAAILKEIEAVIICCFEACDPSVFSVYDKCIEYIKEHL